jgi:hypothetical protein
MRAIRLLTVSSLLAACPSEYAPPDDGHTSAREIVAKQGENAAPAPTPAAPSAPLARKVDILVVVDDSGSMADEQVALPPPLLDLVGSLVSGNRAYPAAPRSEADSFTPFESVHVGFVSTNMGRPPGVQNPAGALTCTEDSGVSLGGGGKLRADGAAAALDLFDVPTKALVRPAIRACRDVELDEPYFAFGTGAGERDLRDVDATKQAELELQCVGTLGVSGCGIEQPLEAMWKALAPASQNDFVGPDTHGQGTGDNAGFLREDSLLVVLTVSDEDDCSLTAEGGKMFEQGDVDGYAVSVRCQMLQDTPAAEGALQPIERYVAGLLGLRGGDASRVVYGAIGGFPQGDALAASTLLDEPAMTTSLAPDEPSMLAFVCGGETSVGMGASPGRRYVKLAEALEDRGAAVELQSVCDLDYADILTRIGERVIGAAE